MDERDDEWIVPMVGGLALVTVGILLLETTAWFVQYGVMGLGLLFTVVSLYRGMSETPPA
jgi:hypothetical protein